MEMGPEKIQAVAGSSKDYRDRWTVLEYKTMALKLDICGHVHCVDFNDRQTFPRGNAKRSYQIDRPRKTSLPSRPIHRWQLLGTQISVCLNIVAGDRSFLT